MGAAEHRFQLRGVVIRRFHMHALILREKLPTQWRQADRVQHVLVAGASPMLAGIAGRDAVQNDRGRYRDTRQRRFAAAATPLRRNKV